MNELVFFTATYLTLYTVVLLSLYLATIFQLYKPSKLLYIQTKIAMCVFKINLDILSWDHGKHHSMWCTHS